MIDTQNVLFSLVMCVILLICIFHHSYRQKIPRAVMLIEGELRRRVYPNKSSRLFFLRQPVPLYEVPFVVWDLRELKRDGVLKTCEEFIDERGCIIPKTPEFLKKVERFHQCISLAYENTQGRIEHRRDILQQSPYAYIQYLFTLDNQSGAVRKKQVEQTL